MKHKQPPTHLRVGLTGVGSLAALIGGLVLHSHYEPIKQVCDSGVGALGQTLSTSAQSHCSLDSSLAEYGIWIAVIGGFLLAVAVVVTILGLLDKPGTSD